MNEHDTPKVVSLGAPLPAGDYFSREEAERLVGAVVADARRASRVGRVVGCTGFRFPDPSAPEGSRTVWAADLVVVDSRTPEKSAERMHCPSKSFYAQWRVLDGAQRDAALTAHHEHFARLRQGTNVSLTPTAARRP
ncbi:MAG: hypothetical protein ACRCT8_00690 [Lacipirellulaceae bacterium]